MLSGIINIYKPINISSAHVVSAIKKILIVGGEDKNIKIGHLGTLDPAAEGVLPLAIGRATRLFRYHLEEDKEYLARFRFGFSTDTFDLEGIIIKKSNVIPTVEEIENILPQLEGQFAQIPPKYSAKSIGGIRAYSLARQGIDFELPAKEITIKKIELIEQYAKEEFSFLISCSSGTYIRSIVRDMAKILGTEATMTYLKRQKSGIFKLENSITLDKINYEIIKNNLMSIENCFISFPKISLSSDETKWLLDGKNLNKDFFGVIGRVIVLSNNNIVGIGVVINNLLNIETWLIE